MLLATIWSEAPRKPRDETHMVVMNLLGRSISTYRALLALMRGGFTDQAWMLNRSMFEDLVLGYWFSLPENRGNAAQIVGGHLADTEERIEYLLGQLAADGLESLGQRPQDPVTAWKGKSPLGKKKGGLQAMVTDIEPLWIKCEGSVAELHAQHEVGHWRSDLALHTTGKSLTDTLMRGSVRVGNARWYAYGQANAADEREMIHLFDFAAFRLGWLARLVLIEAGRPLGELEAAYLAVKDAARDWIPAQLRRLGRNDPCWCGSGKKFSACHRARQGPLTSTSS